MLRKIRYLTVLLCLSVFFGTCSVESAAAEEVTVYVSVEKFVLGQGYVVTPTKRKAVAGSNVFEIVETLLKEENYTIGKHYDKNMGWYLEGIDGADNGKTQVPQSVRNLSGYGYGTAYPSGELPVTENEDYPGLYQINSYQAEGSMSGWCYYVNNYFANVGMDKYTVKDQDVIRLQFTICDGDLALIGDIDSGTKSLAVIKEYLGNKSLNTQVKSVYDKYVKSLSDMDQGKDAVLQLQKDLQATVTALQEADKVCAKINGIGTVTLAKESAISAARKAYNALGKEAKGYISSGVAAKLTSAEKNLASLKKAAEIKKYTPAKVKISKISSTKKKVKLTWKKISSASGYEIQMSTKKSSGFKKIAVIKKAKTVTYTKKKLPSKKTRYFRIRAFRKVGKTTYNGKFSAVKKIKVK